MKCLQPSAQAASPSINYEHHPASLALAGGAFRFKHPRPIMTDLTQNQLELLGAMARTYQNNTGKLPVSIEDIADHWYEMSDHIVVKEHIDEDGRHHPAETVFDVDTPNHCLECIWLRELAKRSDAEALLAQALLAS
jgi:hypothetical protein